MGTSRIKLLFDSFLQPAFEGARSAGTGTRQMLYRADPFQIDIQVEAAAGRNRIVVTGQLLNLSNPGMLDQGTKIALSNMRGRVVNAMTHPFVAFIVVTVHSARLQMTFANPR